MKIFLTFWLLVVSVVGFGAEPDVYLLGCSDQYVGNLIRVWRNGKLTNIKDGAGYKSARSLFVDGEDVYVGGCLIEDDMYSAAIWKNGIVKPLWDGTTQSGANAIFVSGDDVYVGGYIYNGNKDIAMIWKNGVAKPMTTSRSNSDIKFVTIVDSTLYACGYQNTSNEMDIAKVWIGNSGFSLSRGDERSWISDLAVIGADVYSLGCEDSGYDIATNCSSVKYVIWKNRAVADMVWGEDLMLTDIDTDGENLYVAGREKVEGEYRAKIWKNGEPTTLAKGDKGTNATSIFVLGDDVYVAGVEDNGEKINLKVWKNGQLFSSFDGVVGVSSLKIFVVDKR